MKYNSVTGRFENPDGSKATQKAVKDGLGNNVKDYIYNPAENKFEHKDDLVHESPLPVGMPKEPKIHSAAYRRKYPERYKSGYVSKEDRIVAQLKDLKEFGRNKSTEKRDHYKHLVKTGKLLEPTKEEIKRAKAPSTWDIIYQDMSPIKKGQHNAEQRKKGYDGKTGDKISEIKIDYKAPTYFPTNERIEETRPPNFEVTPDPDLQKGLGSLLGTVKEDYKK
jgi:hypothetical protein